MEERDLLAAIVDSPLDLSARARYQRWLGEKGDKLERIAFVLSDAIKAIVECSGAQPPDFWFYFDSGFSQAWLNMMGVPLLKAVTSNPIHWKLRDLVFKYVNPRLGIIAEAVGVDELPIEGSRFGGLAALPDDLAWPSCGKGPLAFIAQIALSEIKTTQAARFLPPDGWLSFFAYNQHVGGNYDTHDCRAIYTPCTTRLSRRNPPDGVQFKSAQSCRLVFHETWDLPDGDVVIRDPDRSRLNESWKNDDVDFDSLREAFGRFDGHLLGDLRHYSTDTVARSVTDRNLICFASISSLMWNWCDGGHLSIYTENEDMMNRRFDKSVGYAA